MKVLLRLASHLWEKPAYGVVLLLLLGLGYLLHGGGEVRLSLMFSPERARPVHTDGQVAGGRDSSKNEQFDSKSVDSWPQ